MAELSANGCRRRAAECVVAAVACVAEVPARKVELPERDEHALAAAAAVSETGEIPTSIERLK